MSGKFYIATFGCRVNQADSAAIKAQLETEGLRQSEDISDCSFVIVNSCTVTHSSDQQVRQMIRRLRRQNPAARILVTGCYAQGNPKEIAAMPEVDLILGNLEKSRISDFVKEFASSEFRVAGGEIEQSAGVHSPTLPLPRSPTLPLQLPSYFNSSKIFVSNLSRETEIEVQPVATLEGKTRPFVKIQEGCDSRCTYCIVPFVRGAGRSVPPESVISQVRRLIDDGYKEVVLTGIHLGSYGSKLHPRTRLEDLIARLLDLSRLEQLRLSSIEPMRFSRKLIDLAEQESRFAPHFHLPLQSGANEILRRMDRNYDRRHYADLLTEIHNRLPHASIGTDVMAGFPGESEALFEETLQFVRQMPFSYLHVFPYSRRSGTPAADMASQVDESLKHRRVTALRRCSDEKLRAFSDRFVGTRLRALILHEREAEYWTGLTGNYLKVKVPVEVAQVNEFVDVRIERRGEVLYGAC
jgi:threonylcarbamoyladenosine tRNA methylthiotransferase MtaB